MKLYALGALDIYDGLYDFKEVAMTIFQPRRDNVSTYTESVEVLRQWAEEELKPKAKLANAGEGEFCSGDWCLFCKAAVKCRARAQAKLELAKQEFSLPPTLTDEEMQVLTDVAGQQTTADTVSADVMPELAQTDEVQPMDKQADVFQKESKSDEVRTQQPQTKQTAEQQTMEQQTDAGDADSQTGDQVKSAQPEKMTADQTSSDVAKTQTAMQMQDTAGVQTMAHAADVTSETSYISVDTMDLLEQVAEQIRVNVSQGTSSMEMQLNPENLGKVYVNISSKEGMIHAQLAASNEAVRAALETQVADLRQNLNQAGVKVDAIEVTVASHEFEKNLEQNQENEKQQGERQQEQSGGRRRNLNLSSLDGLSGLMTEEETLAAQMMRENGNSMDVTA